MPRQKTADRQQPAKAKAQVNKQPSKRSGGAGDDKTAKGKKPHGRGGVTCPTPAQKAMMLERQILVYELVKSGIHSFRKISEHLKSKGFKYSGKSTVATDFKEALAARREKALYTNVDDLLHMAIETNFDMLPAVVGRARKYGKKDDIQTVQGIWKDIDRYTQFSKTQKSETNAQLALAKLLGVDVEDLPNAGDSEQ